MPRRAPISQRSESEKRHYGQYITFSMQTKQIQSARAFQGQTNRGGKKKVKARKDRRRRATTSGFFSSGCCFGRFRAERLSVSKAKLKRDTTAYITLWMQIKQIQHAGALCGQTKESSRVGSRNRGLSNLPQLQL